jgi:Cysteine-rich CWC
MAINGGSPNAQPVGCGPEVKVCAACGETFSCAARAAGCWCEETKLTKEALIELRARYSDCLCPRCLWAAASPPAGKTQ